jgi:hypothetical protein
MRVVATVLMITGIFAGMLSLGLLMTGWWGLAPHALMFAGAVLILAAVIGALSRA